MAGAENPGKDTPSQGHGQMRTKQFDRRLLNQMARLFFRNPSDDPNTDQTSLDTYSEVSPDAGLPVAIVDYGQPTGWMYQTPAASATTTYRGLAVLHSIVINTTAAATITVYDGINATVGIKLATLKASIAEGTYVFDSKLTNGAVTFVLAGASDVTVHLG